MTDARDLDARARADAYDLVRARAGDTAAFAALVRRHQDRVFGFILRMLDTRDEAMELTQDVFLKAWQALPGWRAEARFSTWLLQIARNAALDQLRLPAGGPVRAARRRPGRGQRLAGAGRALCQPPAPRPARVRPAADRRRAREILLLREVEDLSYGELAAVLGVAEGTGEIPPRARPRRAARQFSVETARVRWNDQYC